jgi:signal transduction histidine kinase
VLLDGDRPKFWPIGRPLSFLSLLNDSGCVDNDIMPGVPERLAAVIGAGGDPWMGVAKILAEASGAEAALLFGDGRKLATFGVVPADLVPEGLTERLVRAGFAEARVMNLVAAGEHAVGILALASRTPGRITPETIESALPLVSLRLWAEAEVLRRESIEARFVDVERLATVGLVGAAVAHDVIQPASALASDTRDLCLQLERIIEMLGDRGPIFSEALDRYTEVAHDVRASADKMKDLLIDFRLSMRVGGDAGSSGLVLVGDVVRAALRLAGPLARDKVKIDLSIEQGLPAIAGTKKRLEQALVNLVVNAIHAATVRGVDAARVAARCRREAEEIVVEIQDNGPGIPAEVMPKIFEPFFSTKPKEQGTGLGLPITREIVEAHGGRIEVESERGRGALFRVRLPIRDEPWASDEHPRVLVVDDDEGVARAIQRALKDGFDVAIAQGGINGLRALVQANGAFDAVIVDLYMPDLDGPGLFEAVKERWPGLEKKIVFATGGAYTPAAKQFLDGVPNRRFEKPIDGATLAPILHQVMRKA